MNEHGLIKRVLFENDLDIEEQSSATPLVIDLKIINSHLQDFKLYALQRQDKSFSQQLWKKVNDLEKLVLKEPKTYTQTRLDNYLKLILKHY